MSDLNDPRVLFAAERNLLAWNRKSISLMAFGFLVERFGLFLQRAGREEIRVFQRHFSFFIGCILCSAGRINVYLKHLDWLKYRQDIISMLEL